jgi:hypothetical protein
MGCVTPPPARVETTLFALRRRPGLAGRRPGRSGPVRAGLFRQNCQVTLDDLSRARPVSGGTLGAGRARRPTPSRPAGSRNACHLRAPSFRATFCSMRQRTDLAKKHPPQPRIRCRLRPLGVQYLPHRDVCPQGPRERGSATGIAKSLVAQRVRNLSRAGGHARNLPTGRKKAWGVSTGTTRLGAKIATS